MLLAVSLRNRISVLLVLLVSIVLSVIYFSFDYVETIGTSFRGVNSKILFALVIINSLALLVNGLILKNILHFFNIKLSTGKCFGISTVSSFGNYFVRGGGTLGKAIYLKKIHNFPYHAFIAIMTAICLVNLLLASLLGISTIVFIKDFVNTEIYALLPAFGCLGIASLSLILCPISRLPINKKIFKVLNSIIEGWALLKKDKCLLIKITLLLLVNYFLAFAELFFSYKAFSINISISSLLLILVVSNIAGIITIIPANLGIQEGIIASLSHFLGVSFTQGLLAAGLLRVISITLLCFYTILGASIFNQNFTWKTTIQYRRKIFETQLKNHA